MLAARVRGPTHASSRDHNDRDENDGALELSGPTELSSDIVDLERHDKMAEWREWRVVHYR
jgi:hypothetical protein